MTHCARIQYYPVINVFNIKVNCLKHFSCLICVPHLWHLLDCGGHFLRLKDILGGIKTFLVLLLHALLILLLPKLPAPGCQKTGPKKFIPDMFPFIPFLVAWLKVFFPCCCITCCCCMPCCMSCYCMAGAIILFLLGAMKLFCMAFNCYCCGCIHWFACIAGVAIAGTCW